MASVAFDYPRTGTWRFSRRDSLFIALTGLQAVALFLWPVAPLIAIGIWWNSNTVAHNFVHRPFFRSAPANRSFSAVLSLLLGIPQTLWRDRHLAHHAGVEWRLRLSKALVIETALVLCLWMTLAILRPHIFLFAYVPGYLIGLTLCALQGHWEHATDRPVSHYGGLYNLLCFNDGYHAEHHADPSIHWTQLPHRIESDAASSPWPPLLRWLDINPLEILERLVLRSDRLQRFVLDRHRTALCSLLAQFPRDRNITRVIIVGGGLFPRTALILRELLPAAQLTIVDSNRRNLAIARALLSDNFDYRHERYQSGHVSVCDLIVFPLCFEGDRASIYHDPPAAATLVHDWIWRRRGTGSIVSPLLLKRINLVLK